MICPASSLSLSLSLSLSEEDLLLKGTKCPCVFWSTTSDNLRGLQCTTWQMNRSGAIHKTSCALPSDVPAWLRPCLHPHVSHYLQIHILHRWSCFWLLLLNDMLVFPCPSGQFVSILYWRESERWRYIHHRSPASRKTFFNSAIIHPEVGTLIGCALDLLRLSCTYGRSNPLFHFFSSIEWSITSMVIKRSPWTVYIGYGFTRLSPDLFHNLARNEGLEGLPVD